MRVAGLLLTGGASRRMGLPKSELLVHGERLADRGARVLQTVCDPVLEIGPGHGTLHAVREEPAGVGPLAALAAGGAALRARGHDGPVLAVAVDLPFIDASLLAWLARAEPSGTLVPRVEGVPQPLCARYHADALHAAKELVAAGERTLRALLAAVAVTYADEEAWGSVTTPNAFADVDDMEAAARAGIQPPGGR